MLGPLISAGAALLGGSMQQSSVDKANARSAKQARNARKIANRRYVNEIARSEKWAQKNIDLQEQFAQEGIRWKVADAKAAGIHPLYALGANTTSYSPITVGGVSGGGASGPIQSSFLPDAGMSEALASAGQDIGRAVTAMQTPQEKLASALQLERLALDNELIRAQITATRNPATGRGPGMPSVTGPQLNFAGSKATPPKGAVSADDAEQWFWEIGGALAGINNLLNADWEYQNNYKSEQPKISDRIRAGNNYWSNYFHGGR